MSCAARFAKTNLRLDLRDAGHKQQSNFERTNSGAGSLSPNLQPATPPTFPSNYKEPAATKVADKYLLLERLEGSTLRRCINIQNQQEFVCKVVPNAKYKDELSGYFRLDSHPYINYIVEVIVGRTSTYVIFPKYHGDLHALVRTERNLREPEVLTYFKQIASAVAACHEAGIVLRDVKLRKFVFKDSDRKEVKLETLDDSHLFEDEDDFLDDKHGCPAYVSPEILSRTCSTFSGRAADCWSLGVMLYTMLVGRYPFHDTTANGLFCKIRHGAFIVPEHISSRAKCLIKSLLRVDPAERLTAEEVLEHPWFQHSKYSDEFSGFDQTVPDNDVKTESDDTTWIII